jgi:hypothetical protein
MPDVSEEHIVSIFRVEGLNQARNQFSLPQASAGFLLGLLFKAEDGGYMFVRNVGLLSIDRTALYPRR